MDIKLDRLQLIYGKGFDASRNIHLKNPLVGEVVEAGEESFFSTLSKLTAIPSDMKAILDDSGMDYMKVSDFELFGMLIQGIGERESSFFFRGVDLSKMRPCQRLDGEIILAIPNTNITIDFLVHMRIAEYLTSIFGIKKKVEHAGNEYTRRALIEEERENREVAMKKEFKSSLLPLISSMANSKGFKYDYDEILKMPFAQFMDAVNRVQLISSTDHLAFGYYSGSFDTKKFNVKKLDWTRDLVN